MPLYRLGDIEDNPYFTIGTFELHRKKIDALKESMNRTGAWGGWIARIGPNGKPQQAFGHHRKRAALELYGEDYTIELCIENLTDADMIRIMADENAQEWEHDAFTTINTVRAVVEALAEEHIKLPELADNTRLDYIRLAPSFRTGNVQPAQDADRATRKKIIAEYRNHPSAYTAATVAGFLGWTTENGLAAHNVVDALDALEFMEMSVAYPETFSGLSIEQMSALVSEMRRRQEAHMRSVRSAQKALVSVQKRADKAETEEERQAAFDELEELRRNQPDINEVKQTAAAESALIADRLSQQFRGGELSARNVSQVRSAISHINPNGQSAEVEPDYNELVGHLVRTIDRVFTDEKKTSQDLRTILENYERVTVENRTELNRALGDASSRFLQYMCPIPELEQEEEQTAPEPEPASQYQPDPVPYEAPPPPPMQPQQQQQPQYVQPHQPQDAFSGRSSFR